MRYSVTIAGLLVQLAGLLGMTAFPPQDELTKALEALIQLIGLCIAWWGRYRHGDITAWGKKQRTG